MKEWGMQCKFTERVKVKVFPVDPVVTVLCQAHALEVGVTSVILCTEMQLRSTYKMSNKVLVLNSAPAPKTSESSNVIEEGRIAVVQV